MSHTPAKMPQPAWIAYQRERWEREHDDALYCTKTARALLASSARDAENSSRVRLLDQGGIDPAGSSVRREGEGS